MKQFAHWGLAAASIAILGFGAVEAGAAPMGLRVADATAPAAPVEDPAMTKMATSLLAQAQSGNVDPKIFSPKMNAALTPDVVASVSKQIAPLGKPKSITLVDQSDSYGFKSYRYRIAWDSVSLDEIISLESDGKIAGWLFRPAIQSSAPAAAPSGSPAPATQRSI